MISCAQINNSNTVTNEAPSVAEPKALEEEAEEVQEVKIESQKKAKALKVQDKKEVESVTRSEDSYVKTKSEAELKQDAFMYSSEEARMQRTQRTPSAARQATMDETVGYFEKKSPESFEYHYFKYVGGNYDVNLREHLIQAEKLRPENSDVHIQLAALYEIEAQKDLQKDYLVKLANSGRLANSSILYSEDVLLSAGNRKFVIAHAMEDALALWYQQSVNGSKSDLTIISLDLLQSDVYRKNLKSKGLLLPNSQLVDAAYLHSFLKMNAIHQPLLSMTIPKEYFTGIADKLYVNGLTFIYSEVPITEDSNEKLWNSTLKKHLTKNAKDEKGKQLSANYLPMLITLKDNYEKAEDKAKVKEIDAVITHVVTQCRKQGAYSKVSE